MIALPVFCGYTAFIWPLATLADVPCYQRLVVIAELWTGGLQAQAVPDINIFGLEINRYSTAFTNFTICVLFVAIMIVLVSTAILMRTPTGRSLRRYATANLSAGNGHQPDETKRCRFSVATNSRGCRRAVLVHSAGYVTNETLIWFMSITLLLD